MKLTVKQIVKKIKKVEGLETAIYSCSLEGQEFRMESGVWGKLTLESENPEALKMIVKQAIDAEVDILFTNSQKTLDDYELKLEREFAEITRAKQRILDSSLNSENKSLAENIVDTFGVAGAKAMVEAVKEIVSGQANGKTYNINVDKPGSDEP